MKYKTVNLAEKFRKALLSLGDDQLATIIEENMNEFSMKWPEDGDFLAEKLGYRWISLITDVDYNNLTELQNAEPDGRGYRMIQPGADIIRKIISEMTTKEFYHCVVMLFAENSIHEGMTPSSSSDGYLWMKNVTFSFTTKIQKRQV